MADFSMWGPEQSGFRLAEQDSIANYARLAQANHQNALAQQEAQVARQKQAEMDAFSKLTTPDGKGGPGVGGSVADIFYDQARQLSRLGQPMAASQMAVRASQVLQHEGQAREQQALAAENEIDAKVKMATVLSELHGRATNGRQWASANMMFSSMFPGKDNPLANVPFSPEAAQQAGNFGIKQAELLHSQQEAIRTGILAADQKSKAVTRVARTEIYRDKVDSQETVDEARVKALGRNTGAGGGGKAKAVGSPTRPEVEQTAGLLRELFKTVELPKEGLGVIATSIASEAKALVEANRGMDPQTARALAVQKALKRGDLEVFTDEGVAGTGFRQKQRLRSNLGGDTPETALSADATTKFREGKYYDTPKGRLKRVAGGWEVPSTSTRTAPPPPEE